MGGGCRLRAVSSADLPALAALERLSFSDPWSVPELREALAWTGAVAVAAEDDDQAVIGYVLGRVIVDEGEILTIAIDPERRRGGIGRQLLDAVLAAMVDRGVHAAWLEVRVSNDAARTMYASAGFVATGVRRGYYRRPPEDAIILRRELARDASVSPPPQ